MSRRICEKWDSGKMRQPLPDTMQSQVPTATQPRRLAIAAVGVFLIFGTCMAALAGTTLVWRGTVLDKVWALNRPAYNLLSVAGRPVGALFLLLSAALLAAAVGWFHRRLWGWRLAVAIICTQVAGDIFNFARGDHLRGGIGIAIAGALLFYLLLPNVRAAFQ